MASVLQRRPTRLAATLILVLTAVLLSGCLRYTESLTVKEDDTVSGIIVIAARKSGSSGSVPMPTPAPGQELPRPESGSSRIVVSSFDHDQESGYKVTFRGATFEEVSAFEPLGEKDGALKISRDGDLLKISMTINLTYAAKTEEIDYFKEQAKATVSLTVPGEIVSTDGEVAGQTITWDLQPLELNTLEATVESPKGTAAVESTRSIDLTRAAIIAAILLGLLGLGWLLGRNRIRAALASGPAPPKARRDTDSRDTDRAEPGYAPVTGAIRPAPHTGSLTAPDPFGGAEHSSGVAEPAAPSPPVPAATAPTASRVRETAREKSDGVTIAGGGWPPPRPRWKEHR